MPQDQVTPAESVDAPGGIGGQLFDRDVNERSDIHLIRRAIREGWPITPEQRKLVVDKMVHVIDKGRDNRNKIAASRVLVAADSVNARREATWEDSQRPAPGGQTNVQINVGALTDGQLEQLGQLIDQVAPGALDRVETRSGDEEVPA